MAVQYHNFAIGLGLPRIKGVRAALACLFAILFSVAQAAAQDRQQGGGENNPWATFDDEAREDAFDRALISRFPFSPEELKRLRALVDEIQRATAEPPRGLEAQPNTRVKTLSLDPGSPPPQVFVHTDFVTTLSFLDATGKPWPILDVAYGGEFQIESPEDGSHIVRIISGTNYGAGNLSIRLANLAMPVTLRLQANKERVDYRFDAIIPQSGPNAEPALVRAGLRPAAGDDGVMLALLQGVPPESAERLEIDGADAASRAYRIGDRFFLRTPLQLLSPGWKSSVSAADGTRVYALNEAPVLLLSDNGVMVRARISERENGQ